MDVLTSETCWAVNWHNNASVIKLVHLYSNIKMMHGPIHIRRQRKVAKVEVETGFRTETCGSEGCSKRSSPSGFFRTVIMLLGCSKADPARIANLPTQLSVTSAVSWWEHRISTLSAVDAQYTHWLFASGTHIVFVISTNRRSQMSGKAFLDWSILILSMAR